VSYVKVGSGHHVKLKQSISTPGPMQKEIVSILSSIPKVYNQGIYDREYKCQNRVHNLHIQSKILIYIL